MTARLFSQWLLCGEIVVLGAVALTAFAVGGPVAPRQMAFWAALLLSGAATAAIAYVATRRLTRSLDAMAQGVNDYARGKFEQRLRSDACEEAERLAAALETLREALSAAREGMRAEVERLTTILESMTDAVIAVDDQQRITLSNRACKHLLRLATPDLAGRPLLEATRSRPLHDAVRQALSRPGPMTAEFELADAPTRWLLLRAARLPGNPCPGVVVVLHDVSEIRRLENLRKEFVANVSHELKTPLASIKANAETLSGGAVNDPTINLRFVQNIEADAERLHQLIVDMLQIARIESHQQAFHITRVVLDDVVRRCVEQMRPHAAMKQLELVVESPPSPVAIDADEEGVQTILANLVDNAIKYTPSGVIALRWWSAGEAVFLQVADTGIGISPEYQARIFERFYRVDQARTRGVGGTGLGLSIVKHLMQAFRGDVRVESQPGKGTLFELRFPAHKAEGENSP